MKAKLIVLTSLLSFLTTGIVFAKYNSGPIFGQIGNAAASAERKEPNSLPTPNNISECGAIRDKFQQVLCRLRAFREKGALDELLAERDKIEQEWGKQAGAAYGTLSLEFLGVLTSARYGSADDRALNLSQDYAIQSLKKANTFDLETEWQILNYLRYSLSETKLNDSQAQLRSEHVKLWLHALQRLANEKDENFDPNDLPQINVPLPPGVNGMAGMAPEAIRDPKLRADYKAAIKANAKKMEYYNQQYRVRQNEDLIIKNAVKYISKMYSKEPANPGELDDLLNEYKISESIKNDIKEKINLLLEKKP